MFDLQKSIGISAGSCKIYSRADGSVYGTGGNYLHPFYTKQSVHWSEMSILQKVGIVYPKSWVAEGRRTSCCEQ
jgi:hypothetical protein